MPLVEYGFERFHRENVSLRFIEYSIHTELIKRRSTFQISVQFFLLKGIDSCANKKAENKDTTQTYAVIHVFHLVVIDLHQRIIIHIFQSFCVKKSRIPRP